MWRAGSSVADRDVQQRIHGMFKHNTPLLLMALWLHREGPASFDAAGV